MKKALRIGVVGGGPGGLTLARILWTRGVACTVFERDASDSHRGQGGSLDLHTDTAQFALRMAGLEAEFLSIARYEDQGTRLYDPAGTLRFEHSGGSAEGDRPEVDRSALRKILLDSLAPGTVRWGRKLRSVVPRADGASDLVFESGEIETFDLVVGADGTWSKVRPLVSDAKPAYSGVTFADLCLDDVDERHPELSRLVGRGKMLAMGDNRGLIAQRNGHARVHVYVALRVPEGWAASGEVNFARPAEARAKLVDHFPGWSPRLLALIREAGDTIVTWPIHALPIGHRWITRPGITLLGDAAHVMSPFSGEGVNLAMRDAADLACALADADDWQAAVRAYEATMCDRAEVEAVGAAEGLDSAIATDGLEHSLRFMQEIHAEPAHPQSPA